MAIDDLLALLAGELSRHAVGEHEPEGYVRGVRDALTALEDLAAGTALADILVSLLLVDTGQHGGDPANRDELDQTSSWLAGFALARTQEDGPASVDVKQAAEIARGSVAVVDHARARIENSFIADEGNRVRSLTLLARCRILVRLARELHEPSRS